MNKDRSRDEQPIHKAYELLPPWCEWGEATPSIKYGVSAEEVRCDAGVGEIDGIKIRRSPEHDIFLPLLDGCLDGVSRSQRRTLAEANGNGTSAEGFRKIFSAPKDDPDLQAILGRGLVRGISYRGDLGPERFDYFYLTKQGRRGARSMLHRRRGREKIWG